MKKESIIGLVVVLLILALLFTGCTSAEAQNVVDMIDGIGEVSVDSKQSIDEALEAYNSLDDKDKKSVKNIDVLYAAQESFEEFIPEYISETVSDYRFSDNINYEELKSFVSEYYDYFDEEQKEIIGCSIGKCKIQELAVSVVKEAMKNPASFELVSFDPGYIFKSDDDIYSSLIEITYRGTNSFGGIVPDTISGTIDFRVDFDTCTIEYDSSFFL